MIAKVLRVSEHIWIPEKELQFTYVASGGPGGQNVNKRSTKAVLRWNPRTAATVPAEVLDRFTTRFGSRLSGDGTLVLTSERYRDQARNRTDCLEKLCAMLRTVQRAPRRRRATRPKPSAVERRLRNKRRRSGTKRLRCPPDESEL